MNDAAAQAEKAAAADTGAREPASGEAVLNLEGTRGAEFSGTCFVGGEEREISGQAPAHYTFTLDGDGIECEIQKQDPDGTLKVVFAASGARSVQSTTGGGSTVNITYQNGSVSYSTTSSGTTNVVTSSSSSVVSSSTSASR